METITNKVQNNIDASKHKRKKNLLTALDKALEELDTFTHWIAKNPKEVDFNCCSSCIFGSSQFEDDTKPRVAYNIQTLQDYKSSYKENRKDKWEKAEMGWIRAEESHSGEVVYLQHWGDLELDEDYKILIEVLNKNGIYVHWDWTLDNKMIVVLDKYKEENTHYYY